MAICQPVAARTSGDGSTTAKSAAAIESVCTSIINMAEIKIGEKNLAEAQRLLEMVRPLCEKTGSPTLQGNVLKNLGRVSLASGRNPDKLQQARDMLLKAKTFYEKAGNQTGIRTVLMDLGAVYFRLWEYARSIEMLNQALDKFSGAGDSASQGQINKLLGDLYFRLSDMEKAESHYNKAEPLLKSSKDLSSRAGVLKGLGEIKLQGEDIEIGKADKTLDEALHLYEQANDREGQGRVWRILGHKKLLAGDVLGAEGSFHKAQRFCNDADDAQCVGDALKGLGDLRHNTGQGQEAESYCNEALIKYREIGDGLGKARTLHLIGEILFDRGDTKKAEENLRSALELYDQHNHYRGSGDALRIIGNIHRYLGDSVGAAKSYNASEEMLKKAGAPRYMGNLLKDIGEVALESGKLEDAEKCFNSALEYFKKTHYKKGEALVRTKLGDVSLRKRSLKEAETLYQNALDFSATFPTHMSGAFLGLGDVKFRNNDISGAEDSFRMALLLSEKAGNPDGQGDALNRLAVLKSRTGHIGTAEEYFQKAGPFFQNAGNQRRKYKFKRDYGDSKLSAGNINEAEILYKEALSFLQYIADPAAKANLYKSLGDLYAKKTDWIGAEGHYREAISLSGQAGDKTGQARALNALGDLNIALNKTAEATKHLEKAISLFKQANSLRGLANAYKSMGDLKLSRGENKRAVEFYMLALGSTDRHPKLRDLYYDKGRAEEAMGDLAAASSSYQNAIKYAEDILSQARGDKLKMSLRDQISKLYDAPIRVAAMLSKKRKEAAADEGLKALRLVEQGRSKILYSRLREAGINPAKSMLREELLQQERNLEEEIAALKSLMQDGSGQDMKDKLEKKEREREEFIEGLWAITEYKPYVAIKYPKKDLELDSLHLDPLETLVEYYVSSDAIYRWIVVNKKILSFDRLQISRKELDTQLARARDPILKAAETRVIPPTKGKEWDDYIGACRILFDKLLGPAFPINPKGRLVIVPDGPLHFLPFEMLVTGCAGKKCTFLGLTTAIVYAPSIKAFELSRLMHAVKSYPDRKMLLVGDPIFNMSNDARCVEGMKPCDGESPEDIAAQLKGCTAYKAVMGFNTTGVAAGSQEMDKKLAAKSAGHLERLCESRREIRAMAERFPERTDMLEGLNAGKEAVLKALEEHMYQAILFSTHGLMPEERSCPENQSCMPEPALVFSVRGASDSHYGKDAFLELDEIYGLNLNTEVVALSACETGLGKESKGEGVSGMGQAFLYAGSRSVLMSLWSVESETTADLMVSFFAAALREQNSRDQVKALLNARRKIAEDPSHTERAHPFFWAPFILYGTAE
ncbi:MAG: tetratricopeptide repeat protein [Candidatus Peribacteraceae bacterium]|nr:tetratricopeptide repeat protein [Candidatus Peribacteraceae bacterium]